MITYSNFLTEVFDTGKTYDYRLEKQFSGSRIGRVEGFFTTANNEKMYVRVEMHEEEIEVAFKDRDTGYRVTRKNNLSGALMLYNTVIKITREAIKIINNYLLNRMDQMGIPYRDMAVVFSAFDPATKKVYQRFATQLARELNGKESSRGSNFRVDYELLIND